MPNSRTKQGRLFVALAAAVAVCSAPTSAAAPHAFSKLDEMLDRQCADRSFSGVVVVRDRGREVYNKACGQADILNEVPISRSTRFRIFSTSKFLTALAILRLVEEGQIELDGSIRRYVPDAPAEWEAVTVRKLLNHTSGIPDLTDQLLWHFRSDHPAAMRSLLSQLNAEQRKLATAPGDRFRYNNFGFELLADAGAKAAGASFATVLDQQLFKRAGMTNAVVEEPKMAAGHPVATESTGLASGYNGKLGKLTHANPWAFVQLGAGAVQATADDFLALDEALKANKVVSRESWAKMLADPASAVRPDGSLSPRKFGLGVFLERIAGVPLVGHTGGNNGYVSEYQRLYGGEAMFVVLANRGSADLKPIREAVVASLEAARGRE